MIAGPLYGEEGIVLADCDLRRGLHAKRLFDAVGHYSRADVLGSAPFRCAGGTPTGARDRRQAAVDGGPTEQNAVSDRSTRARGPPRSACSRDAVIGCRGSGVHRRWTCSPRHRRADERTAADPTRAARRIRPQVLDDGACESPTATATARSRGLGTRDRPARRVRHRLRVERTVAPTGAMRHRARSDLARVRSASA